MAGNRCADHAYVIDARVTVAVAAGMVSAGAAAIGVLARASAAPLVAGVAGLLAATASVAVAAHTTRVLAQIDARYAHADRMRRDFLRRNPHAPTTALLDGATGLFTEALLHPLLEQRLAAARRYVRPVALVAFEIDQVADAPDNERRAAVVAIGALLRDTLRESDAAFELGAGRLAAVLDETDDVGAVCAVERVRGALANSEHGTRFTLSAGIACYPLHALGAGQLLTEALAALHAARRHGRDWVEVAS